MSQLYDVDQFVPAPSVELICAVCQNVLLDPVECDCRHVFCRSCISKWLAEGPDSSCPKCRSRVSVISLRTVVPLLQNLLNELQLRCANAGCDWQKSLEQYDAHVKVCTFRRLPCPHKGCFQTLPSDSLGAHKEACEHRVIKCSDWCGLDFTLQQRSSHNCRTAVLTLLNDIKQHNRDLTNLADELRSYNAELERELASVKAQLESTQQRSDEDEDANASVGTPVLLSESESELESDPIGDDVFLHRSSSSDSGGGLVELVPRCSSTSSDLVSSSSDLSKCNPNSSGEVMPNDWHSHSEDSLTWRRRRKRSLSGDGFNSRAAKRLRNSRTSDNPSSSSSESSSDSPIATHWRKRKRDDSSVSSSSSNETSDSEISIRE